MLGFLITLPVLQNSDPFFSEYVANIELMTFFLIHDYHADSMNSQLLIKINVPEISLTRKPLASKWRKSVKSWETSWS